MSGRPKLDSASICEDRPPVVIKREQLKEDCKLLRKAAKMGIASDYVVLMGHLLERNASARRIVPVLSGALSGHPTDTEFIDAISPRRIGL